MNKKIFVGGIPRGTTKFKLQQYFEQFGNVEETVIMFKRENKGLGFAFIIFENSSSVDRVIKNYKNNIFEGQFIECKIAKMKEEIQREEEQNLKRSQPFLQDASPPNKLFSQFSKLPSQYNETPPIITQNLQSFSQDLVSFPDDFSQSNAMTPSNQ